MTLHQSERPIPAFVGSSARVPDADRQTEATLSNNAVLLLGDLAGLALAFLLAGILSLLIEEKIFHFVSTDTVAAEARARLFQFLLLSGFVLIWHNERGHYDTRLPFWTETKQIMIALTLAAVLDGFLQYIMKVQVSRGCLAETWVLAFVFLMAGRQLGKAWLRRRGTWDLATIIVGARADAAAAARMVKAERTLGYRVVATVDPADLSIADNADCRTELYRRFDADFVLVVPDAHDSVPCNNLIAVLTRQVLPFALVPATAGIPVFGLNPVYVLSHDLVMLMGRSNLAHPVAQTFKRCIDLIGVAAIGLVLLVLAPVLTAIVLAIKADGGPALYRQTRVGFGGRRFACFKFRSMIVNSDHVLKDYLARNPEAAAEWQRDVKLRHDPRITAIGRFLRTTSLDELPQLLNVFQGDMSLVGPRPIVPAEIERYGADIAYYYQVRPGITGLWQVSGRNDVDYPTRVRLDCWYVKNWTFWHDVAILFKTLPALISGRGAC
ncbi:MAG: undecaprenyl-phosphate galactose phosphotransferase WbaP [Rhodospirillaceae bacterium]